MAQLDRLIKEISRRQAEALILAPGKQPSLLHEGRLQAIVNTVLDAAMVARLVGEIAPQADRAVLAGGRPVAFPYVTDGLQVRIEGDTKSSISVTLVDGNAAATPVVPARTPTIDALFRLMVERGASDLHLSSQSVPLLRVDGELVPVPQSALLAPEVLEQMFREIAPPRNWEEYERDHDTDFAHAITGLCRFRCNLFLDRRGPGGVFRVIPSKILTVDDLGLSQEIRNLCHLTKGLVLVTGPTGSGKSTTLTALVDHVNTIRKDHIITIEDPIEFVHDNRNCLINQREVSVHTQGFKRALRAALREDPDIVLVGEMRDLETVSVALETAETGHLVFGTLHTSSAVSTVDRLVDQFSAEEQGQIRVMLAETLKAVIAQVLCRKKEGGRVAALEVLLAVPAVSNLIREGKTFQIPSIMQTGRRHGMITLTESLLDLVRQGVVEPQEAYVRAVDKASLLTAFKTNKIHLEVPGGPREAGPATPA